MDEVPPGRDAAGGVELMDLTEDASDGELDAMLEMAMGEQEAERTDLERSVAPPGEAVRETGA
jgi:hypothetical protein